MPMIRSFIAVALPGMVQRALEKIEKELQAARAAVSWVKPERIHLTLKFLGNVFPEQIIGIQQALDKVAAVASPLRLQPAGCGAFPTIKQMRVVWVGLRGDGELLQKLQQEVDAAMVPLGFEPEKRPFRAHLTLGRVKGRQGLRALQEALLAQQTFAAEAFDVNELVLYKSELKPEGARYTPLYRAVLGDRREG